MASSAPLQASPPARRGRRGGSGPRAAVEQEDDDDDLPSPKPKAKRRKRPALEEDDDEDEWLARGDVSQAKVGPQRSVLQADSLVLGAAQQMAGRIRQDSRKLQCVLASWYLSLQALTQPLHTGTPTEPCPIQSMSFGSSTRTACLGLLTILVGARRPRARPAARDEDWEPEDGEVEGQSA